ncbi:testis-expressed protein 47 [Kryptolebias marmoratus]|uniref:testis-expressed protein 47 n=1 Tax=Kryptolebias marmoratus TaxID=37003 RepID=UPI0007F89AC9|nr:testis-expressed protein 47 [Kryptolebias marmoratus]
MDEEGENITMFDVVYAKMREKIVLQRLIVIARLRCDLTDREELRAHYEKLNFRLKKQHVGDPITGLLLIYPSCLLQVIESSGVVLTSVLKDLAAMQQQPDDGLLETKIVFIAHNLQSRLFQKWSYKLLDENQVAGHAVVKRLEEEEESTQFLVCSVLSALKKLGELLETTQEVLPGSVLDETPELIVPEKILEKLLGRDELITPQQYLQMYQSPLKISIEFGQVNLRSFLSFR